MYVIANENGLGLNSTRLNTNTKYKNKILTTILIWKYHRSTAHYGISMIYFGLHKQNLYKTVHTERKRAENTWKMEKTGQSVECNWSSN